jgi:hypothetical protein
MADAFKVDVDVTYPLTVDAFKKDVSKKEI